MRVRYHPALPAISFGLGTLFVVLDVLLLVGGEGFNLTMIVGPLFLLLGTQQVTTPYFDYDPASWTITVHNGFGMKRRYGGFNGGRLHVVGNRYQCVLPDGRTKKVPVAAWCARKPEWHAVMATLNQQTAGGPAVR